jgi:2-oxoglutarate dehydrogenase E2 component (dihydrolipoamide succinyltransferase)
MEFLFTHNQDDPNQTTRVIQWLKGEGEVVQAQDDLLEIEVDKAEIVVASPVSGILREIGAESGDEILDGDLIAVFELPDEAG